MPHPNGGNGNTFETRHTFAEAFAHVNGRDVVFNSTTGESITATTSFAQDGVTPTIVFNGVNVRHGNVCAFCWGYRRNCSDTRIGHCVEGLDAITP